MESERERRKRQWTEQSLSLAQEKQTKARVRRILLKPDEERNPEEQSFLEEHEEEAEEVREALARQAENKKLREDKMEEKEDPPGVIAAKVAQLCQLIEQACERNGGRGVVLHSGAGLSTSAGIPDFRGPQGVWTLQSRGLPAPPVPRYEAVQPTAGHAAVAAMVQAGVIRHIVTQNVDGLHARSGVPANQVSELHGSVFRERCVRCGAVHERAFDVTAAKGSSFRRHKTGRRCDALLPAALGSGNSEEGTGREQECGAQARAAAGVKKEEGEEAEREGSGGEEEAMRAEDHGEWPGEEEKGVQAVKDQGAGQLSSVKPEHEHPSGSDGCSQLTGSDVCGGELVDSIVHFGERLDPATLAAATAHSSEADLALCVGSSFKVPPANKLPRLARRVALLNLQRTPLDRAACLCLHARIDDVLVAVAQRLGLKVDSPQQPAAPLTGSLAISCSAPIGASTLFQKKVKGKRKLGSKRSSRPSFPKAPKVSS